MALPAIIRYYIENILKKKGLQLYNRYARNKMDIIVYKYWYKKLFDFNSGTLIMQ